MRKKKKFYKKREGLFTRAGRDRARENVFKIKKKEF